MLLFTTWYTRHTCDNATICCCATAHIIDATTHATAHATAHATHATDAIGVDCGGAEGFFFDKIFFENVLQLRLTVVTSCELNGTTSKVA